MTKIYRISNNVSHTIWLDDNTNNELITNIEKLPVCDKTTIDGIEVYSIFKRGLSQNGKKCYTDGNAFNKAFKGELWKFADGEKEKIISRINEVLCKYLLSHKHDICVVVPSTSGFNDTFANLIHSACGAEIVNKMMVKFTTDEAYEFYNDEINFFHKYYPKKDDREIARNKFKQFLDEMNNKKDGMFCIHLIKDQEMRNRIENVLKIDKTYEEFLKNEKKLFGKNILIIDDLMSRGTSIKNAIDFVKRYSPKTITALTII